MPILFLESKTLRHSLDASKRIELLDALQQKELIPLIRSARQYCFERLVIPPEQISELEAAMANWMELSNGETYTRGDLFCSDDHVFFLTFNVPERVDSPQIRAGIVYQARTPEPFRKLDSFCRDVSDALLTIVDESVAAEQNLSNWEHGPPVMPEGFKRFIARQEADSLYTSLRKESMSRRILAASNLEHQSARAFLRSAREARMEGYAAGLLPGRVESNDFSIENLENVGLVEREVQVSCRKTGHALFRLPNPQALAVVTVSDATCSECGSRVADERVEEVFAPTQLASSLLEDGSWLVNRLHYMLRDLGVSESEIAVGPCEGTGYGQMMTNICGESFLLVTRDGDLTPAFARWAIDLELETEASHLVVVATGKLFNEAAVLLQNHSRSRVSGGHDFALVVADDITTATKELGAAIERVSQRIVADHLCYLDSSVGLNISRLLLTKFNLATATPATPGREEVAESVSQEISRPLALAASASAFSGDVAEPEKSYIDVEATPAIPETEAQPNSESEAPSDTYPAWDQP
jgi:hypothetical protein